MNPSASGWIDKFGYLVKNDNKYCSSFNTMYTKLKKTGFVYGINLNVPDFIAIEHPLSEDEMAKINLLAGLYYTHKFTTGNSDFEVFVKCLLKFYQGLDIAKISFINKLLMGRKTSAKLESLINSRIYLEDNLISKTFNSTITNSLLFIDVLTFKRHLEGVKNKRKIAQRLEHITINITYHTLNSKTKSRNDEKLAQLFASSLTFIDSEESHIDSTYRNDLLDLFTTCEKQYFLDVACLTVWEDQSLAYTESKFIFELGEDMGFSKTHIGKSLFDVTEFFEINAKKIPHLKDQNMAVQFYESMARIVDKLILRNSKRLQKEISESKELVTLLSKSTVKDLTEEEKKKVQDQLLDIFKSIPSLAIFILPGGAVLLPIFIKLIPKLLPSAFDENRVD
ncbi:LETM1-related biofilm-associated protein [Arenibacter latericius]|uniref:LETM1-related biofilm-associated protein n=1 Tax=Arenibacter latericius TaxID=86104 RepID=UPI00041FE1CD|nr:LETM1-related biofilm-associated protein [Arenibacter latericius]